MLSFSVGGHCGLSASVVGGSGAGRRGQQCVWEQALLPPGLVLCQLTVLLGEEPGILSCRALEQSSWDREARPTAVTQFEVLFSVIVSFLGAFLGVCLNFNRFSLTVLYKPWLVDLLILAGSDIAVEETVMMKGSDLPRLTMPVSDLCEFGFCVNLDCANHPLPERMAKQRWHLCLRNNITFPAAGLGSGLSTPQWYTLLETHFASGWVSFLMWPPLFCLTCLLNQKKAEEWDSSRGTKTWVSKLVRKYLVPQTLKIHNFAAVSRD